MNQDCTGVTDVSNFRPRVGTRRGTYLQAVRVKTMRALCERYRIVVFVVLWEPESVNQVRMQSFSGSHVSRRGRWHSAPPSRCSCVRSAVSLRVPWTLRSCSRLVPPAPLVKHCSFVQCTATRSKGTFVAERSLLARRLWVSRRLSEPTSAEVLHKRHRSRRPPTNKLRT